jgi:hypothetical protein
MKVLTKGFLLFPDDFCPEDIEEGISTASSDELQKQESSLSRSSSLELAVKIASGFPAEDVMNPAGQHLADELEYSAHSVILKGGSDGGLFIYYWSSTDRLIWPMARGRIILQRGDLEWMPAYPFVHSLDFKERTISFSCTIAEYTDASNTSVFLSSRNHFGHLARDTIAGQAYLALAYLQKCGAHNKNASFSMLRLNDEYLDKQFKFTLDLLFGEMNISLEQIDCPPIQAGSALILKKSLLHVKTLSKIFPCFDLQDQLELRNPRPISTGKIVHLGIKGSTHKRILNQKEMSHFLEFRNIPSLESYYSPTQRYSLLRSAQVVIAEPSSSIYNYILNCSPSSLCILLLPGSFELELTRRDCCDWFFLLRHLIKGRVIPFFGDRPTSAQSSQSGFSLERLIDEPARYDVKRIEELIDLCIADKS